MPRLLARLRPAPRRAAAALAGLLTAAGCAPDSTGPVPIDDPSRLYWALTLDHRAVNLSTEAPANAQRVVAIPRRSDGSALADVGPPTYHSSDPTRVQVDADGLVRAVRTGERVLVVATLVVGNVRHADTAVVRVTADAAPVAPPALSIQPLPGDSAVWQANRLDSYGLFGARPIVAHDGEGSPLTDLAIHYESSDTTIAVIDRTTGLLDGQRPGVVTLRASTVAYGRTLRDSVRFTVTLPVYAIVAAYPPGFFGPTTVFQPGRVTIPEGGSVLWLTGNPEPMEITFDDPTHVAEEGMLCLCGSGDIPAFPMEEQQRARTFPVVGTYHYRTTSNGGAAGSIVVVPKPVDTAPWSLTAARALRAGSR